MQTLPLILYFVVLASVFSVNVVAPSKERSCLCTKKVKRCGPTPEVLNGEYVLASPEHDYYGDEAQLVCDEGFTESQPTTIACQKNGKWEQATSFCQSPSLAGTFYVTVFPRVSRNSNGEVQLRQIYITAEEETEVNLISPFTDFNQTVTVNNFTVVEFPVTFTLTQNNSLQFKAIEIRSNKAINIHTLCYRNSTSQVAMESWIAIPVDKLSKEYIAITTDMSPQIFIAGVTDDTLCNITRPGQGPVSRTVNRFQVYTLFINAVDDFVDNDFSGTIITCTQNVAVFSGGFYATVPITFSGSRDMNMVQLLGVEIWSTRFLFAPYRPRNEYQIKVIAIETNTTVHLDNGVNSSALILERAKDIRLYLTTGLPVEITADKPILATQFSITEEVGDVDLGDPSMVQGLSTDRFLNRYAFSVPDGYVEHRLRIVINTAHVDKLLLNNDSLDVNEPILLNTTKTNESFTFIYVPVVEGVFYVLETTNGFTFGADLYGTLKFGQYSQMIGQLFPN